MNNNYAGRWRLFRLTLLLIAPTIAGCGNFQLASDIRQPGKSAEQMNLDILLCKDQSNLATNTVGWQVGQFVAGATLVGIPVALDMEKQKKREVFAQCMTAKGYALTPATDGATAPGNRVTATKIGGNTSTSENISASPIPTKITPTPPAPPPTAAAVAPVPAAQVSAPSVPMSASIPSVNVSAGPNNASGVNPASAAVSTQRDEIAQLEKLKVLREKNLITEVEFNEKRKAILDRL